MTEFFYLLFYFIEPLKKTYGDYGFVLTNSFLFLLVIVILLSILFLYIYSKKYVVDDNNSLKIIFFFTIIFNLTLLFVWPIAALDIFAYINQSRVFSIYGFNPYLVSFDKFPYDSFYFITKQVWWNSVPTPYGPLFILLGSLITKLGSESLALSLFLFKLVFVSVNIACAFLIHKIFKNNLTTFFYAWNPLILFEFGANGHNDVLVIFLLLLSALFFLKKRIYLSWFFLIASVLIKMYVIILLPIFYFFILAQSKGINDKIKKSLFIVAIFITTTVLSYVIFWDGVKIFSSLMLQSEIIWVIPSIFIIISGALLSLARVDFPILTSKIIGQYLFIFSYFWMFYYAIKNKIFLFEKNIFKLYFLSFLLLLLLAIGWLMPWYFTLLIALAVTYHNYANNKIVENIIYGTTLYGILYYLVLR